MNKNVVLFLTSPNNSNRIQMSLENFKQLENLGYDIITLTTHDLLPNYIYENSKFVMHDYTSHKCDKKFYYDYYKSSGGGYFMYDVNDNHKVIFFHETHFPSLLRNYKSLIFAAKTFGYENYFYIEDDHYIHNRDLNKIRYYFDKLNDYSNVVFCFKKHTTSDELVYSTYFNFGRVDEMFNMTKNFAYTENEYKTFDVNIYGNFFETVFTRLLNLYKSKDANILEITEDFKNVFPYSTLNKVYSYRNLLDDARCNFISDVINERPILYYSSINLTEGLDLKVYVGKKLHDHTIIYPGCWYFTVIDSNLIDQTEVVINDKLIKNFKNSKQFCYNGEITFNC